MVFSCNIEHDSFNYSTNHYALFLSKVFYCTFSPGNPRNGVHHHLCYEVCLALSGSGTFNCGGSTYRIEPNMLFIVSPNIDHEIISQENEWLKLYFFTFAISPMPASSDVWTEQDGLIDRFMRKHQTVARNCGFLSCYADFQQNYQVNGGRGAIKPMALVMLLDFLEALSMVRNDDLTQADHPLANRIAAYISGHIQSDISVADLCQYARVSPRTVYLLFATYFQMPPAHYISKMKLQAAIGYLNMGFPIKTVAELMGFNDLSSFSRRFKKMTGQSPRHYLSGRS